MPDDLSDGPAAEARRQIGICNACRYCEGYCDMFPAVFRERVVADGDLTQLANLCHNCRACYHSCQYTAPHEFDLNLPRVLAELRAETRPVCSLRWVAQAAPERLAGGWGYRADCRGLFGRILRITGTLSMRHEGGGSFAGSARNSLGESGSAAARVTGNAVATRIDFPRASVRGSFTTSTRSMTMSGRDSNGCDVVAWKN